jgi:hypothetical protein
MRYPRSAYVGGPVRILPLVILVVLVGCGQDYDLSGGKDPEGTDTTTTDTPIEGTTDFSDLCDGLSGTPHDVALNSECDVDLQTGTFTPVVKWHYGNSSFCGPPGIGQTADTNGNGVLDDADMPIIFLYNGGTNGTSNGKVVALKGDNSGVLWQTAQGVGQDGGFAIGDLDHDGWPEVVGVGTQRVVAMDGRTGAVKWMSNSLAANIDPLGYNYPSILDMDGDGNPEVTVGNAILDGATGRVLGTGTKGKGAAPYGGDPRASLGSYGTLSVPYDLDGDGQAELVTGNAAYNIDGSVKWQNTGLDGLIAIADFDGDGQGEIVKTSGSFITGMETDGTEVWGPLPYSGNVGAASIDDLDGDGVPDIVFAAQNSLVALDWGGAVKWTARIDDVSGAAGPVLFDFELDGYPEVLYADETSVRFFSGLDGSIKYNSREHGSYTILETPAVADVDNDGHVEIVLGHCSWSHSLTVYGDQNDSWPPGRKTWNQHGYSISNIGDLGVVPTGPSPNYADYNSFRSGDVGVPPGEYLDLQAEIFDVCDTECDDGRVYVGAWVLNSGNLEAPAGIPVSIQAGPTGAVLATQYTTTAIPSGGTGEPLIFEIDAAAMGTAKPVAVADEDATGVGVVYECDERNNIFDWSSSTCDE